MVARSSNSIGFPDRETFPGLLVIGFDWGFSSATAEVFEDKIRIAVQSARDPITCVVIDFGGVNFVDSHGSAALAKISRTTAAAGVRCDCHACTQTS